MTEKEIKDAVNYWRQIAERDYETMTILFKKKRYPESLFFGHIVIEKILKALVVDATKKQPPFTHDLVMLEKLAGLQLSEKEIDFLDSLNDFNIRARYPEYRLKIYKICTQKYTDKIVTKIETLYKTLCQSIK